MPTPTDAPYRGRLRRSLAIVLLTIVVSLATVSTGAAASSDSTFPVLSPVIGSSSLPDEIMVSGHGFAPGGLVYIALYDQWGMTLHETRWVTASDISYQPPQDLAPGEGFSFDTGGNIAETFLIDVGPSAGPAGSQILASGALTGAPTTMAGIDCTTSLMVRAYDRSTATWTNTIDVSLGCGG